MAAVAGSSCSEAGWQPDLPREREARTGEAGRGKRKRTKSECRGVSVEAGGRSGEVSPSRADQQGQQGGSSENQVAQGVHCVTVLCTVPGTGLLSYHSQGTIQPSIEFSTVHFGAGAEPAARSPQTARSRRQGVPRPKGILKQCPQSVTYCSIWFLMLLRAL